MVLLKGLSLMLPFFLGCSSVAAPAEEQKATTQSPAKETPPTTKPIDKSPPSWALLGATAAQWKAHYKVDDPYTKLTNDHGDGYEDLYGTRNFRVVLHGVYYRGGANNTYNRNLKRSNMNPLQNGGLKNLCEEGFATSVYFYPNNFSGAPKVTPCGDVTGSNQLEYQQITAFNKNNHEALLNLIFQRIKGQIHGPIYGHCWNGWHASGLIASLALQQFCDWTPAEAGDYWKKNTDGNAKGYEAVLRQVMSFHKILKYEITSGEKAAICPGK